MLIVLTGGKFNHIHPGHVWLLRKAKKLGFLVVVLAHDRHNKRDYATAAGTRKKEIEKLKIANRIVIGSPTSFVTVVRKYKPNVIVLGYDQKLPPGTEEYIRKHKIAILRFRKHGTYATRKLSKAK